MKDTKKLVTQAFGSLGFVVIFWNEKPSANGPDLWVTRNNGRPLSVELKVTRILQNGMAQVDPVSENRKKDDLIAIVLTNYVLIEPMSDHLKCCSPKGTRQMTLIMGKGTKIT